MTRLLLVTLGLLTLTACGSSGGLRVEGRPSDGLPAVFDRDFPLCRFDRDERGQVRILMLDGEEAHWTTAVAIRIFWLPRAGRTPIDPSATNATIHLIVRNAPTGSLGVYAGAGFVLPRDDPGDASFAVSILGSTMTLTDATPAFADRLGQATLTGRLRAQRNPAELERLWQSVQVTLREALGHPRLVMGIQEVAVTEDLF